MEELKILEIVTLVILVLNFIGALVVVPWLGRITKLETKMEKLTDLVQTQYMSKSDFENHLNRIESALSEIKGYVMNNRLP